MQHAQQEGLRPGDRAQLERIAAALGLAAGRARLLLEFQDGHLRWYEPSLVRVPASTLEELVAADRVPE